MIYIVVIVAVVLVPMKLGGYGAVFDAADAAFKAKGSARTGLMLKPAQYPALRLAGTRLGARRLHVSAHADRHLRLARARHDPQERGPAAGLHAAARPDRAARLHGPTRRGIKVSSNNDVVPALFKTLFPAWFAGFAFAAIAIGALVPAAVMSIGAANLFTRNFWKAYVNPSVTPAGEAQVAKITSLRGQGRRAGRRSCSCRRSSRSICSCSAACGSCRPSRR